MPNNSGKAPRATAVRLSIYLRELESLKARGVDNVSSGQLGRSLGLTPAQVRKDLAYFGQFGSRGVGYGVERLIREIQKILGTDREWNVVILGVGNLGRALAGHPPLRARGFKVVGLFDSDPAKSGRKVARLSIRPVEELPRAVADLDVALGIIAVPAAEAQKAADLLVGAGVKGILNFSPATINVPDKVVIESVDVGMALEQVSFHMK
jgi:redox-sensing transcriptional repressor